MRGRKYALWAVVISAAFVTAGLIISCGDDDGNGNGNGGAAVSCQDVCEKLAECYGSLGPFGETVEDCEEACEEELAGGGGSLAEAFACIPDTDCWDIWGSCLCQPVCEKLIDCAPEDDGMLLPMAICVSECEKDFPLETIMCVLKFSSCHYIQEVCLFDL